MIKLYILPLLIIFTLFFTKSNLYSETYQLECSMGYEQSNSKAGRILVSSINQFAYVGPFIDISFKNTNIYLINTIYNFDEVKTDESPYEQASFYQKTSYVGITALQDKVELEHGYNKGDEKITFIKPVVNLLLPDTNVFCNLSYQYAFIKGYVDEGGYDNYTIKLTSDFFTMAIGYYLTNGFTITGNFGSGGTKTENNKIYSLNIYNLAMKYVTMINHNMGIHVSGNYTYVSSKYGNSKNEIINHKFSINSDFYITPKICIGGAIEINQGDDKFYAGNTYSIRTSIFIISNFALEGEYIIFNPENKNTYSYYESDSVKTFSAKLKIRF